MASTDRGIQIVVSHGENIKLCANAHSPSIASLPAGANVRLDMSLQESKQQEASVLIVEGIQID
jgi:hypothetical protein